MAVSPQERRYLLSQLSNLAVRDLNNLLEQAHRLSDVEFAAFVVDAYPRLADPYIEMAAQLAASWFEEGNPDQADVPVTADPLPEAQLQASARWALSALNAPDVEARLSGTLQRSVFDGARSTTVANVERTGSRWMRHARADACAFCRLMSNRGAVYRSEKDALGQEKADAQRGNQALGEKYHDHCFCIAVEVFDGASPDIPAYMDDWDRVYVKARDLANSGDPKQILAAWRQIDGAA
ncbi:MAG: hypothetical protein KDB18_14050 [Salinibacterium sp.]|nr:hypothetical protein [Salinibacterium sp.]